VTVAETQTRGALLRSEITKAHDLDPAQTAILEEACRCADRLDQLDALVVARGAAAALDDGILTEARQQQNVMKQLLVALRLPDTAGKRPQLRSARGAYAPRTSGKVSSLERARAAKSS
jgi:hypothetical protein